MFVYSILYYKVITLQNIYLGKANFSKRRCSEDGMVYVNKLLIIQLFQFFSVSSNVEIGSRHEIASSGRLVSQLAESTSDFAFIYLTYLQIFIGCI